MTRCVALEQRHRALAVTAFKKEAGGFDPLRRGAIPGFFAPSGFCSRCQVADVPPQRCDSLIVETGPHGILEALVRLDDIAVRDQRLSRSESDFECLAPLKELTLLGELLDRRCPQGPGVVSQVFGSNGIDLRHHVLEPSLGERCVTLRDDRIDGAPALQRPD